MLSNSKAGRNFTQPRTRLLAHLCIFTDEWLFDLSSDPNETNNVAADHPDVVSEMKAAIEAEAKGIVSFTVTGRCDASDVSEDGVWVSGCCA